MPDLLIELFSEEIPARMQARARDDLRRLVTDGLVEAGLTYAGAVTPTEAHQLFADGSARLVDVRNRFEWVSPSTSKRPTARHSWSIS